MIAQFVLFTGLNHEEMGGWGDFDSDHATFEDARQEAIRTGPARNSVNGWDWAHIVDLFTGISETLDNGS